MTAFIELSVAPSGPQASAVEASVVAPSTFQPQLAKRNDPAKLPVRKRL